MITTNIDVEDGLVNGAIGILKYVEGFCSEQARSDERREVVLWFQF
jgi:hypothetical protein